ncbi:FG-GAP and VCBS repeat-containing protein [Streptomyces sp. NPDC090057]|uniref:FG-GAP and VCBS repeat-containing protein n=1 Tax=Streptomyces sp. NPDC090057 TaxID=3365935 RepID=UPI0038016761
MRKRAVRMTLSVAVVVAASAAVVPVAQAAPAVGPAKADFNGDGVADVVAAAPDATVNGRALAGYVAVTYGSRTAGLKSQVHKVFQQNTAGVPGSAEQDDRFGAALTTGDLDGDGRTDLVVGSPGEDDGTLDSSGSLTVLWGGKDGLSSATVVKGARARQHLGEALTAGDFDGDGHLDVATGTTVHYGPFGRAGGPARTAAMDVRVNAPDDVLWQIPVLASGDVDGDRVDDVVAIAPHGQDELPYHGPRLLQYFQGSRDGLTAARTLRDAHTGETLDGGADLAVGDLDRDGYADIVLGRSSVDDMEGTADVDAVGGAVEIVRGGAAGPDTAGPRTRFDQDTAGVPGTAEERDDFGSSVSLGDVNGDGRLDLAVGAPREDVGGVTDAGSVTVLLGGSQGLTATGAKSFTQNSASVPGTAEKGDLFGRAVRLADTTGDGRAELYAGAPGENAGAGSVWALPGTAAQPTGTGSVSFGAGALGTVATGASLGAAVDRR